MAVNSCSAYQETSCLCDTCKFITEPFIGRYIDRNTTTAYHLVIILSPLHTMHWSHSVHCTPFIDLTESIPHHVLIALNLDHTQPFTHRMLIILSPLNSFLDHSPFHTILWPFQFILHHTFITHNFKPHCAQPHSSPRRILNHTQCTTLHILIILITFHTMSYHTQSSPHRNWFIFSPFNVATSSNPVHSTPYLDHTQSSPLVPVHVTPCQNSFCRPLSR
jgi:hypothetical protein